jgi:hypothetical protein
MDSRPIIAVLVFSALAATMASATTVIVNWNGSGQFETIQEGIDEASSGDTVLVMPGTYSGEGNRNLDFFATNCVLTSSGGARSVTIDCGGATRGFYFGGVVTAACVVDGFTITNGHAAFGPGGGMYIVNCSPTIRNCVITGNVADDWGGGVYCSTNAGPSFTGCTFSGNQANLGGGASCATNTTPSFEGCTFSDNTASWDAGGIYLNGCSPHFLVCHFDGNSVTDAYGRGGGMYLVAGASPTLSGCTFTENTATWLGGGVMIAEDCNPVFSAISFTDNAAEYGAALGVKGDIAPTFNSSVFYGNDAVYGGGAVYSDAGAVPTFEDCTFGSNTAGDIGGAMYFEYLSTPELMNCTLYANSAPVGSGVWCYDNFTLTNSIIAFGVGGEAVYCDGDPPYVSCSDVYGNGGGDWVGCLAGMLGSDGNFSEDPIFCDAPQGDFGIDVASPCTAANSPGGCGQVGAWGIACDTPVQAESWGAIKAMYR